MVPKVLQIYRSSCDCFCSHYVPECLKFRVLLPARPVSLLLESFLQQSFPDFLFSLSVKGLWEWCPETSHPLPLIGLSELFSKPKLESSTTRLDQGKSLDLWCSIPGAPPANFTIQKENTTVSESQNFTRIVSARDSGTYTCRASVGRVVKRSNAVQITVCGRYMFTGSENLGMGQRLFVTSCHPLQAEGRSDWGRGRTWEKERIVKSRGQTSGCVPTQSTRRRQYKASIGKSQVHAFIVAACWWWSWADKILAARTGSHSGRKHSLFNSKL